VPSDEEFDEFVAVHSRDLLRFAWMLTADAGRAEDLLQSALAKMWPHWSRVTSDGDPQAYLRTVMVHTHSAWWRRRWRGEIPTEIVPEPPTADVFTTIDDRDELRRALSTLPRRQRAVVVLRYYQDLSEIETAAVLGCSPGTVKSQAARGLSRLRDARRTTRDELPAKEQA
jgi:RNA polymerase sigma-70 factor (sigma-E family)